MLFAEKLGFDGEGFDYVTHSIPINTRRYLDVYSTFCERYGRQMDVKTTLCAY